MFRNTLTLLLGCAVLGACSRTVAVSSGGEVEPQVMPANISHAAGRNGPQDQARSTALGTGTGHVGDAFDATVTDDVMAADGRVTIPAGSMVYGRITGLDPATKIDGRAVIRLNFERLTFDGRDYPFSAAITKVHPEESNLTSNQTAHAAVIGATAGAVLGAILGGAELDKILAGGVLGAAGGTVVGLGKGDIEGALPSGTIMTIRASQDVTLR